MENRITFEQKGLVKNNTDITYGSQNTPRYSHRPLTELVTLNDIKSKAFDINISLNPLCAACMPILIATGKIKDQPYHFDAHSLYKALSLEIRVFEEKARKLKYRSAITLAVRYFLCAYIDEMLCSASESIRSLWNERPLLKTVQGESYGGERFFMILERASEDPQAHIDLLELGFLCLSLGYQGKYKLYESQANELENIKDNLLVLIHQCRGEPPEGLFLGNSIPAPAQTATQSRKRGIPHFYVATAMLALSFIGVSVPYHLHLKKLARPIEHKLQIIRQETRHA